MLLVKIATPASVEEDAAEAVAAEDEAVAAEAAEAAEAAVVAAVEREREKEASTLTTPPSTCLEMNGTS